MRKIWHFLLEHLRINKILEKEDKILEKEDKILEKLRLQEEILYAQRFNNTIMDSDWLRYRSFSPGRWAVDYSFLFVLFKILNSMRPTNVIEFGLGQSSKMIHQYASYYQKDAITIEHDKDWVDFFQKDKQGDYHVKIKLMDLEMINYKGIETRTYAEIEEYCNGNKYDLIVVDGPFGSEHYSRPQIINLAKDNLAKSFCVIIDDTHRIGEKETISDLFNVLDNQKIDYCHKTYRSIKSFTVVCSKDLRFLTSL